MLLDIAVFWTLLHKFLLLRSWIPLSILVGFIGGLLAADERHCNSSLLLSIKLHIFASCIRVDQHFCDSLHHTDVKQSHVGTGECLSRRTALMILEHARALTRYAIFIWTWHFPSSKLFLSPDLGLSLPTNKLTTTEWHIYNQSRRLSPVVAIIPLCQSVRCFRWPNQGRVQRFCMSGG
jgi:hypothetical protein